MGLLGGLFNAAAGDKVAVNVSNATCDLTVESSVQEILDWIMIQLCSELNVNEMAFKGGYIYIYIYI